MAKREKQPLPLDGPPPRRNRAAAIGKDAHNLGRAGFERAGFPESGLVLRWREIVGPEIARIARPLRFAESATGGVLTLKADPAAAVFLQHESRTLCGRINAYLGHDAVRRLRFVAGEIETEPGRARPRHSAPEAPPNDPTARFAGVDSLKSALLNLARARRQEA